MKKMRILKKVVKNNFKRCPLGGYCINPICMALGCIET